MGTCIIHIINLVVCLVLLSHHVSGNSNGSEPLCIISIKVPRNTLVRATVKTVLNINCTLTKVKCERIPKITWCKIFGNDCKDLNQSNYTETMWKDITQHDGISSLFFLNISMEDAGLYRCKNQNSVSHAINVTVMDVVVNNKDETTAPSKNNTSHNNTTKALTIQHVDNPEYLKVNICRWTAGLTVILTGVSFIIMRVKSKNDNEANKDIISMANNPSSLVPNADDSNISSSSSSAGIYVNTEEL